MSTFRTKSTSTKANPVEVAAAAALILVFAIVVGGLLTTLGWNIGVGGAVAACGGKAANISLWTGIFINVFLVALAAPLGSTFKNSK